MRELTRCPYCGADTYECRKMKSPFYSCSRCGHIFGLIYVGDQFNKSDEMLLEALKRK